MDNPDPYHLAQRAIADLKAAIRQTLREDEGGELSNADIGRRLGIYMGHKGHEGHIPRVMLSVMEMEGVVEQDSSSKHWRLRRHKSDISTDAG